MQCQTRSHHHACALCSVAFTWSFMMLSFAIIDDQLLLCVRGLVAVKAKTGPDSYPVTICLHVKSQHTVTQIFDSCYLWNLYDWSLIYLTSLVCTRWPGQHVETLIVTIHPSSWVPMSSIMACLVSRGCAASGPAPSYKNSKSEMDRKKLHHINYRENPVPT